jgi:hypothetical protein
MNFAKCSVLFFFKLIKVKLQLKLDVSFDYRNSYCLAMPLPPRDNPKGLAGEPVDGVGALVAGVM